MFNKIRKPLIKRIKVKYGNNRYQLRSKVLSVDDDQKLIDVLRVQGIHLPSACGSMGTCGLCKVKIRGDSGPLTDAEMAKLSDKERSDGIRLSCQVITHGP